MAVNKFFAINLQYWLGIQKFSIQSIVSSQIELQRTMEFFFENNSETGNPGEKLNELSTYVRNRDFVQKRKFIQN